jgi:hypothetical protein
MSPQKRVRLEEGDESPNPETMERKHPGGAELKYNAKQFPKAARFLAARGATQDEIAECFGVSTRILQRWLAQYPALSEAIRAGNDVFNPRVERALAERAIGYWIDEEEKVVINGKVARIIRRKKFIPPDVTACILCCCPRAGRRRATATHRGQGPATSARRRGLLIGEHRISGEKKYYLANLPAKTDLRTLAATIKARWICEQAHQQMKEELGLDHFEGRSWQGLHRHALMTMIAYAFLQSEDTTFQRSRSRAIFPCRQGWRGCPPRGLGKKYNKACSYQEASAVP